jgi:hypothetical protein
MSKQTEEWLHHAGVLTRLAMLRIYGSEQHRSSLPCRMKCFELGRLEDYWGWLQKQTAESLYELEVNLALEKAKNLDAMQLQLE